MKLNDTTPVFSHLFCACSRELYIRIYYYHAMLIKYLRSSISILVAVDFKNVGVYNVQLIFYKTPAKIGVFFGSYLVLVNTKG